ncbi:MAG: hypothetical protein NT084_15645 [Bacteroidetes bacterium]|nr:hypothetical protein [Bacteroidota bacterium]
MSNPTTTKTMKIARRLTLAVLCFTGANAFAQLQDEKNVTITMDLQPILQLNMNTSDQVNFVFDDISDYYGGITRYGATILTVSSTVNWDLYAVGTSNDGTFWDNQMTYGPGTDPLATTQLPLELLELHQSEVNANAVGATGFQPDYSAPFAPAPYVVGQNNIYASATPYVAPAATEKYIQGHSAITDFAPGGSYLTQLTNTSIYYYVIDYRIVPGLPVIFPTAGDNAAVPAPLDLVTVDGPGSYAQPGVYTMNVKYVLLENQ